MAIQLFEPLESPDYARLDDPEREKVDREIREIKTWLRLRSRAFRGARAEPQ
jgi:hypothetical protein